MKSGYIPEGGITVPIFLEIIDIPLESTYDRYEDGIQYKVNSKQTQDEILKLVLQSLDEYHGDERYLDAFTWAVDATDHLYELLHKTTK